MYPAQMEQARIDFGRIEIDRRTPATSSVRIAPEQTFTDSAALEGERKTVTALFADIKGSMDLMEAIDPEEARAIVDHRHPARTVAGLVNEERHAHRRALCDP